MGDVGLFRWKHEQCSAHGPINGPACEGAATAHVVYSDLSFMHHHMDPQGKPRTTTNSQFALQCEIIKGTFVVESIGYLEDRQQPAISAFSLYT